MSTVTDGRTARAARTRDAIVDGLLSLLEQGSLRPTAGEIAARAEVSERSIFQHFANREALLAAVAERQAARIADVVVPIDPATPFETRLDTFVTQRTTVLELLTPTRRAAALIADQHPALARNLDEVRARKRERVLTCFAPELADRDDATRAAVATAASWATWESLRSHQGLTPDAARAAMRELLASVLEHARE